MQSGIPKADCEFKTCHFILNTESVPIKLYLSMFSKCRIIFSFYGHAAVPFKNLKPASKYLSLRNSAHTLCATKKDPSLLSAKVKMQPRNSSCVRKEAK